MNAAGAFVLGVLLSFGGSHVWVAYGWRKLGRGRCLHCGRSPQLLATLADIGSRRIVSTSTLCAPCATFFHRNTPSPPWAEKGDS